MTRVNPTDDFEQYCWHDCRIWGIEFQTGEPEQGDWTSDLRLDIDYICQWLCDSGPCRFRVAPALLVFHEVMNLAISFERRDPAGYPVPAHPLSISEVERQPANKDQSMTDQSQHLWKIKLNDPDGGLISFSASGFTQTLRTEPVLLDEQCFSLRDRRELLARFDK
ncbi:MAG TPA: hypothetical protein VF306_16505 [Pirellulales bacterium]